MEEQRLTRQKKGKATTADAQAAAAVTEAKTDAPKKSRGRPPKKDGAQASAKGAAARKQAVVDTSSDENGVRDAS